MRMEIAKILKIIKKDKGNGDSKKMKKRKKNLMSLGIMEVVIALNQGNSPKQSRISKNLQPI